MSSYVFFVILYYENLNVNITCTKILWKENQPKSNIVKFVCISSEIQATYNSLHYYYHPQPSLRFGDY